MNSPEDHRLCTATKFFLLLPLFVAPSCNGGDKDTSDSVMRVTILHTNDTHSHLTGWGPDAEYTPSTTGDDLTLGGLARTKALIDQIKASSDHQVVLYDAGDWMSGTLFQLLATSRAAELQTIQDMGYDAITLGNHEFDNGPQVLGEMISVATSLGVDVPILASNTVPNPDDSGDDALEELFDSGRIQSTMVQELDNGLRIGLFGILGDEAQSITPAVAPASFTPQDEAAAAAVEELQAQDVDVIIAISHSGVTDDPDTSPDNLMAAAVPGIDIIVGGHSHTPIFDPMYEEDTPIVQAGAYGRYLGELTFTWDGTSVSIESYELHEIDDSIQGDSQITEKISGYIDDLDSGPLQELGYTFSEPIAEIPADVAISGCSESGLGDLITDSFRHEINTIDPSNPVDFAFESQGVIRDSLLAGTTGQQAFSDFFRVLPLGFGTDDVPGYALVDFWVTAKEIGDVCEVTASISPLYGCDYFIEISGLRCNLDMSRSLFNRTIGVDKWDEASQSWVELDTSSSNEQLYHVAVDSYVASLMGILEDLTFSAILIVPKDQQGNEYESTDEMLFDSDPDTAGVQELKLWQALVGFASSFEDTDSDGLPDIDADYTGSDDRIVGYDD